MDNAAIAHGLFDALDAGDFGRFASFFTPDAVIWHNFDKSEVTIPETAAVLQGLGGLVNSAAYVERRYISVSGGAVLQHVLRVTTKDGRLVEMPAMLRVHMEDGLIRRIEEYFDSAQSAAIAGH